MKKVAVLDDYQKVALRMAPWGGLADRLSVSAFHDHVAELGALAERLADFDAVVLNRERTRFGADLLDALPNLRFIATSGMRNAAIDVAHAASRGVVVSGTRTLGYPTAELTWALILALFRHLPQESASIRSGGWQTTLGRGLHGKTLAVAGFGRIGSDVARVGLAFGMNVVAWSRSLTPEAAQAQGVEAVERDELFRRADVLSLHLPLTPATRGLVDARALSLMKPDAVVVNTARGPLVDETALAAALRAGTLGGAGLDVFAQEPLAQASPLRDAPNVLLTPHIGYVTEENYRLTFGEIVEDLSAWLDGTPIRVLTPDTRR
jgi:phosphoglycerate dehydrogenase-like enzyme